MFSKSITLLGITHYTPNKYSTRDHNSLAYPQVIDILPFFLHINWRILATPESLITYSFTRGLFFEISDPTNV